MKTNTCIKCKCEKDASEFTFSKQRGKFLNTCKPCQNIYQIDRLNAFSNAEYLFKQAKKRCNYKGSRDAYLNKEFSISIEDVERVMTDVCPYLEIPIKRYPLTVGGDMSIKPDAISLDRIDSSKGYTPDNIVVCSWLANSMLKNFSVDVFEQSPVLTEFAKKIREVSNEATS